MSNALKRLVHLPLRLIPDAFAMPIIRGPLRGYRWYTAEGMNKCWLGTYEPYCEKHILKYVRPGMIAYDIGANGGYYSLLMSHLVGVQGKVFAFEPLPRNIKRCRRNISINRLDNVVLLPFALASQPGMALFELGVTHAQGRLTSSGVLFSRSAIHVERMTLDIIASKFPAPDFIKMDIEGGEADALAGAELCFRRYRPILLLATHGADIAKTCYALLASWGYAIEQIDQDTIIASVTTPLA